MGVLPAIGVICWKSSRWDSNSLIMLNQDVLQHSPTMLKQWGNGSNLLTFMGDFHAWHDEFCGSTGSSFDPQLSVVALWNPQMWNLTSSSPIFNAPTSEGKSGTRIPVGWGVQLHYSVVNILTRKGILQGKSRNSQRDLVEVKKHPLVIVIGDAPIETSIHRIFSIGTPYHIPKKNTLTSPVVLLHQGRRSRRTSRASRNDWRPWGKWRTWCLTANLEMEEEKWGKYYGTEWYCNFT